MPQWSDHPPKLGENYPLRIVRTPTNKPLTAIATATDVVGCSTHFAQNRTIPCEGEAEDGTRCPWCLEGFSWRWHGYLACILTDTLEHVIFEFTAASSDTFRNYQLLHGNLRGCHFQARRPSGRHNGRVVIACKPTDPQRTRLPDPPNVIKILCHIWNVQHNPTTTHRLPDRLGDVLHVPAGNGDGRNRPDQNQE